MDYTIHGILPAWILELVAVPFSRGSHWPRNQTGVSCFAGGFFTNCYQGSPAKLVVSKSMVKAMAPHSSTLAWKIPWTEEPGRLQSMGLLRVRHDWATSLSLFTFLHWRKKWQPTPVFLPGESQGWGAWWAAVYGVAQSRTQLMRLSSSSSNPNQLSFPEVMTSLKTSFNFTMKCKRLMDCCKMQTKGKAFSKFLSPVN